MHFLGVTINSGAFWLMLYALLASLFPFAVGEMEGGCRVCARECPLFFSSIDNFICTVSFFVILLGEGGYIQQQTISIQIFER